MNPLDQSVYYQNQSAYYQQQSAYYQQQSVAMLAQISQQIAYIALQVSVPSVVPQMSTPAPISQSPVPSTAQQVSTSPPPYPAFKPLLSDIRVNGCWVIGLVCSLSAALLAMLIQHWVHSYMQVFQRYDHPLKRARFRQFFFEGSEGMRKLARQVPRLLHVSLILFFLGFCDSMFNTNTIVGVATIVPTCLLGIFYLYNVTTRLTDLQSPYNTLISRPKLFLIHLYQQLFDNRGWRPPKKFEAYREELVREERARKKRDVRAIRWLVDNTTANAKMETLVLAIPGSFNTEWGREVWKDVSYGLSSDPDTLELQTDCSPAGGPVPLMHHSLRFPEGTAGDTICRCVRYLFETCKNHSYFANDEERHRRMRACVEASASLVCCTGFQLEWFGEVSKLVSEIGRIENINESPTTTTDQSFIVRWTCLSLVSFQQILGSDRLKVLAAYAVSGLARFESEYGQPNETGSRSAQIIEDRLKMAWKPVEKLRQAFEPWTQKRTKEQIEEILRNHEQQISELERIEVEADGMEDVDWRISLYQEAMDDATHGLTRLLPGVSFDEPRRSESFLISDTFNIFPTCGTPVTPQFIFPGQQVRALSRLGSKLREVLYGQAADWHKEVLESLKSVDQVPLSLRQPNGLMKRQLWRLQDLRDGRGLGFTTELFLLSLRKLLSIPALHESNSVFYVGAFKIITSHWEESKDSPGTQSILLNILCDLIIKGRGVFSDFPYPEAITSMLVDMVSNMLRGYTGPDKHIRDAVWEIENVDSLICMDMRLRRLAWEALPRFPGAMEVS